MTLQERKDQFLEDIEKYVDKEFYGYPGCCEVNIPNLLLGMIELEEEEAEAVAPDPSDVTAPTLLSATIESGKSSVIQLMYDEILDPDSVPAFGDFAIENATYLSTGDPVELVEVNGAVVSVGWVAGTKSFGPGDNDIIISYTPGGDKIKDPAGNLAAALVDQPVTNNL